jgi:hypothetical protein
MTRTYPLIGLEWLILFMLLTSQQIVSVSRAIQSKELACEYGGFYQRDKSAAVRFTNLSGEAARR